MAPVRDAIRLVLDGHEPHPALVVDRWWNLVAANASIALFTEDVAPELLEPPVNTLRLALHPDGAAPRILNLREYRADLLDRLRRHVATTGDPELGALYAELCEYPGPEPAGAPGADSAIAVPLRLRAGDAELTLFSTIATFGTAVDITVAELAIEAFFPADAQTAAALRDRAAAPVGAG